MWMQMWQYICSIFLIPFCALGTTILRNHTKMQEDLMSNKSDDVFASTNLKFQNNISQSSNQLESFNANYANGSQRLVNGVINLGKLEREPPSKSQLLHATDVASRATSSFTDHKEQDFNTDTAVRMVKYETGDTIRLKCHIKNGPYLVMWNKIGVDYPLSIGTRRFVPDDRVQIRFKAPDKWRLSISNAKLSDSGVYTCTTSAGNVNEAHGRGEAESQPEQILGNTVNDPAEPAAHPEQLPLGSKHLTSKVAVASNERKGPMNYDYYVTVVEPNPSERFQVDAPAVDRAVKPHKSIVVTGPKIVFYGTPLELICRASFPSSEAKLNPSISLEWYHRGVRRRASATRSGGVYISERWLDSNLLESRLLVAWASEADAGQWICLDRSQFPSAPAVLRTDRDYNYLSYSNRNHMGANSVHLAASKFPDTNGQIAETLAASVANSRERDLMFDRIEVEIVDLPDPTAVPPMDSFADAMPTFVKPGTKHDQDPANHFYGKRETASILQLTSGAGEKNYVGFSSSSVHKPCPAASYLLSLTAISLLRYLLWFNR